MRRFRKAILIPVVMALFIASAVPAFADNVCPVIGGPNNPQVKGTDAVVPDMDGNPAHGTQDAAGNPVNPSPGDVFWN
jgi:hypothetical protein